MTNQALRNGTRRAPLNVLLAWIIVFAGCINADWGPKCPVAAHRVGRRSPGADRGPAVPVPCTGYHSTAWQPWGDGPMALRIGPVCPWAAGLPSALPAAVETLPGAPLPEPISVPEAEKSEKPAPQSGVQPPRSDSLPKAIIRKGGAQVLPPEMKAPSPIPSGKPAAAAGEKPLLKTPDDVPGKLPEDTPEDMPDEAPAPPPSAHAGNGSTITVAREAVHEIHVVEAQTDADGHHVLMVDERSEVFPAGFFTHSPLPQAPGRR